MNAPAHTHQPKPIDFDTYVGKYVKVRDRIKEIEERHALELKPYREVLEKLDSYLLKALQDTGQVNAKTNSGTVYLSQKDSVSLADPDAFMRHVVGTQSFELLDRKASLTAVRAFMKENNSQLPPGVNFTTREAIGVRRPTGKAAE